MGIPQLYNIYLQHPCVQTDTRKLQPGDFYFALKGPNFNGNLFALQALGQGAAYCIVDEDIKIADERIIKVDDVLTTLQYLAKHHRQQFAIPFIAITGSNGKTTTKELINEVLSTTYKTYTTIGNLNNHIGIPLTILSVKKDAALAVIEMGANHQKEIEQYCTYTLPTHGLITNCGKAHLEGFGGEEGVKKGKGELYDFLRSNNGTAFVMWDYSYLQNMSKGIRQIITYGTHDADITGQIINNNELLEVAITKGAAIENIKTHLVGGYNLPNVLAAVSVGKYFNVGDNDIKKALENYIPSNSRSQLIEKDSNTIILDAYNANPTSMKAAIENFAAMKSSNPKILLLGGMMELGNDSITEHQQIIECINKYVWEKVVLVGGDYYKAKHNYIYFENAAEAKEWFQKQNLTNTTILIKGSRSVQMEKVLN
jgi:UDP-N-acetylmuramoyl-tripeptide--D-alanyl-D-alanine ligase